MKIQRKWRRAWQRGKRSYYTRWWLRQKQQPLIAEHRKQARNKRSDSTTRWVSTAAASFLLTTVCVGASVWAAPVSHDAANNIHTDGRTSTSFAIAGTMNNITTSTVAGVNGLNSFTQFNVKAGNTVNLYVPTGANNLINLVSGGQSQINGMLNSVKNNAIGGNVYFLNPSGVVVGIGGSINAGSLAVYTPTQNFIDTFFDNSNLINAVAHVTDGSLPISASGLITIEGSINVINDVKFGSGKATITSGGRLNAGASFISSAPFDNVVNTNAWNEVAIPTAIATNQDGSIEIVAGGLNNAGTIYSGGAQDFSVSGGSVRLENSGTIDGRSAVSFSGITLAPDGILENSGHIYDNNFLYSGDSDSRNNITIDGSTDTNFSFTKNGSSWITHITTTTQTDRTATNSFSCFNAANGNIINLIVPETADNLINLVSGGRSVIDGTIRSIKDGKVAGNLFFLNPDSLLVGSTGSINAGSLTVQKASNIDIKGTITTTGDQNLSASAINLSGNLQTGGGNFIVHSKTVFKLIVVRSFPPARSRTACC